MKAIDNKELILALEELEKEKGIKKEYVLESIETALVTAYKRNFDALENLKVDIDHKTGATHIYSVKEIVWERDNHKCILCHKYVPIECACCHFIPRSQGGLGIPENIFTACNNCHTEQDNGLNTLELEAKVEKHLQKCYGLNWEKDNLVYKKGGR